MSAYSELIDERFKKDNPSYKEYADYLYLLNAPKEYKCEDIMLEYLKAHPNATTDELCDYLDDNVSDGLPDGVDFSDLQEDD